MSLNLYRLVKVRSVIETPEHFDFSLEDCSVTFVASKLFLKELGIESIVVGQQFFVKGKLGNEDVLLASPDSIEDIREA